MDIQSIDRKKMLMAIGIGFIVVFLIVLLMRISKTKKERQAVIAPVIQEESKTLTQEDISQILKERSNDMNNKSLLTKSEIGEILKKRK